jgi:hypothetical protein
VLYGVLTCSGRPAVWLGADAELSPGRSNGDLKRLKNFGPVAKVDSFPSPKIDLEQLSDKAKTDVQGVMRCKKVW